MGGTKAIGKAGRAPQTPRMNTNCHWDVMLKSPLKRGRLRLGRLRRPLKSARGPRGNHLTSSPTAAGSGKSQDDQKQHGPHGGRDNRADNSRAHMDAQLRQQPSANERAQDAAEFDAKRTVNTRQAGQQSDDAGQLARASR